MLRELLKCSILTSVVLTGCNTMPRENNSSVLMEDVIVERTTVRSTTQNPKQKQGSGGVYISGDNITIGTIIVNSPGARVDNSTNTVIQTNQQQNNNTGTKSNRFVDFHHNPPPNQYHDVDSNFFKGIDGVMMKLLPSFVMGAAIDK